MKKKVDIRRARKPRSSVHKHAKRIVARSPSAATGPPHNLRTVTKPTERTPTGFVWDGALLIRESDARPKPVKPSKMKMGMHKAKDAIVEVMEELTTFVAKDKYRIKEIELAVGVNADGKFMGFGLGSDATVTIRIAPVG